MPRWISKCLHQLSGRSREFLLVLTLLLIPTSIAFGHEMSPILIAVLFSIVAMRAAIWGLLIGAHAIRYPTRWVAKFTPSFGIAFLCSFLAVFVAFVIGIFLGKFFYLGFLEDFPLPAKQNTPVGAFGVWFLFCSFIFAFMIRSPAKKLLGIPKGLIIGAIQVLVLVVILRILAFMVG